MWWSVHTGAAACVQVRIPGAQRFYPALAIWGCVPGEVLSQANGHVPLHIYNILHPAGGQLELSRLADMYRLFTM